MTSYTTPISFTVCVSSPVHVPECKKLIVSGLCLDFFWFLKIYMMMAGLFSGFSHDVWLKGFSGHSREVHYDLMQYANRQSWQQTVITSVWTIMHFADY